MNKPLPLTHSQEAVKKRLGKLWKVPIKDWPWLKQSAKGFEDGPWQDDYVRILNQFLVEAVQSISMEEYLHLRARAIGAASAIKIDRMIMGIAAEEKL